MGKEAHAMEERTAKRLKFIIDVCYWAVITLLGYLAVRYAIPWTLPFLLALLLVSAVHPVIRLLKRRLHIEREIVSFFIMLLVYVLVCTLVIFLGAQLVYLLRGLFSSLPDYYELTLRPAILAISRTLSHFLENLPEAFQTQTEALQESILSTLQSALLGASQSGIAALGSLSARIPAFLIALLFTVMLSFFISMQYGRVTSFLRSLLPPAGDKLLADLVSVMKETVVKYVRAALTLMVITFAELTLGLLILGRPRAVLIAMGIAVFDALPIFGTGAIMIPWTVVELLQGKLPEALGLACLYGVVTLVRNVIEPKIVGDKLGLNPIASITAIYVGFRTMGVIGMILMPILVQTFLALRDKGWFAGTRKDAPEPASATPEE